MIGGGKKLWRVYSYNAATDKYTVEYLGQSGVRQCWFSARRDDRNGCFWLTFEGRVPYGEIPKTRRIYFDEAKWEI